MPREPVLDFAETVPLMVDIGRAELGRRIDARFEAMLDEGGLDEVLQLQAMHLDPALPVMAALGVRSLLRHLAGELTRADAVAAGQTETRQYAKRQLTWMRSNMIAWKAVAAQEMEMSSGQISFL